MKSEGKISDWTSGEERETEGERVGVGLGTQRNLADCSTSESLNRFVTERKRREGGRDERRDMRDNLTYAFWKISPS